MYSDWGGPRCQTTSLRSEGNCHFLIAYVDAEVCKKKKILFNPLFEQKRTVCVYPALALTKNEVPPPWLWCLEEVYESQQ